MWEWLVQTWFPPSSTDTFITREHFHHARHTVCAVCVAYGRRSNFALSGATCYTFPAGVIAVCKFHDQNGFCGMCLKDDNIIKSEPPDYQSTLSPVDDFDTWFGNLSYTCEKCRTHASRQAMRRNGITLTTARQTDMDELFSNYQTFGEGSILNLCAQVHERRWLLSNTKIKDFSLQAVAGDRLLRGVSLAEAMNSDSEDAYILYTEPSIRDLAMREFMRGWILDGGWFSPNDVVDLQQHHQYNRNPYFHNNQPIPITVVHPTRQESKYSPWFYTIPSNDVKETLQSLWHQTINDILDTAFKNIIAEVLDGCLVDSKVWEFERGETAPGSISDPAQQLTSWDLNQVWERLLKSEYWVTGYNWRSRKLAEHRDRRISDASLGSKSSSNSSESANLSGSPTGTVSTMQTTPSPPPVAASKEGKSPEMTTHMEESEASKSPRSPVGSLPELPDIELTGVEARVVQSVPFVPFKWEVLPAFTVRWIWNLWLKSIHPFVACQCGICRRACKLQEEARLRGSPPKRQAQTGGIVINEPAHRKREELEDEDEDEDIEDDLVSNEEDLLNTSQDMDVVVEDEEATIGNDALSEINTTPVQLIQQPATPPNLSTPDPGSMLSTPSTEMTQTFLSRMGRSVTPRESLSPPTGQKRSSQEVESIPSTPSSTKRRRLNSDDSSLSPLVSSSIPNSQDETVLSEMTYASPKFDSQDTNVPSTLQSSNLTTSSNPSAETLHPARFEEVTGIAPPKESVGINLLDFAFDEDSEEAEERHYALLEGRY